MKIKLLLALCLCTSAAYGQVKFSDLGNATALQSGDLFIIGRPGDKNYNITALQLPFELGLQPTNANLTAWSLLDPTTYATKSYAQGLTNGFVDRSITNGSATQAYAQAVTNGYPWGSLYDAVGAGTTAATAATNALAGSAWGKADGLTSGTVAPARLGSGASITTKFLRGDSTWQTIGGGGDMLAANNLSDVANAATSLANIGGVPTTRTLTVSGTANQITSSAGAQDLSANRTVTLSIPTTFTAPGSVSATSFFGLDQWQTITNAVDHTRIVTNTITGKWYSFGTNGVFAINGAPLADASALKASQFVKTDANTNLQSSMDATGLTNTVAFTHEGTTTNINVAFNGTIQSFTVTNGPDVWLNWSGQNGSAAFQFTTNVSIHSSTTFNKFLAGSNGVSTGVYKITNGWFTVTSAGGTNATQLSPAIVENQ